MVRRIRDNILKLDNPFFEQFPAALKHPDADNWGFQWSLHHRFAWAVPTPRALQSIQDFAPHGIVEIGAGTGYWASLLKAAGVDVVAYDYSPVEFGRNRFHSNEKSEVPVTNFFPVERGDARLAALHSDRALLLCWPPHDAHQGRSVRERTMSHRALSAYQGNRLIYVGQKPGGLTGSARFHQIVKESWRLVDQIRLPSFPGKESWVHLYERRCGTSSRA